MNQSNNQLRQAVKSLVDKLAAKDADIARLKELLSESQRLAQNRLIGLCKCGEERLALTSDLRLAREEAEAARELLRGENCNAGVAVMILNDKSTRDRWMNAVRNRDLASKPATEGIDYKCTGGHALCNGGLSAGPSCPCCEATDATGEVTL